MPKMPGVVVDGPWEPEDEVKVEEAMAKPMPVDDKANPFVQYLGSGLPAQKVEVAKPSLWDRFKGNFRAAQDYGWVGLEELSDIRGADRGYYKGVGVGLEQGKAHADFLRAMRLERQDAYARMPGSETTLEYLAAIGGGVSGAMADPLSLAGAPVKIGTTGWRAASPVFSRILDYSVSNAAMNAGLNAVVQVEEGRAGLRDEVDLTSLGIDAAAGALFGLPFGYAAGRAASAEAAMLRAMTRPAPGTAPMAPRVDPRAELRPVPITEGPATPETLGAAHSPEDISKAQETLFGEVVGTRNLDQEQLDRLDDYLNAGKAGEIPQAPIETEGSAGPDELAKAAFDVEQVPREAVSVRDETQPQDQAVRQVRERGGEEGTAQPAPLSVGRQYREFAPAELKVDAKRFQFKEGGNEAGVTDRLKGVKTWDQTKAGVTLVWEDKAGNFFIADGHQRHGLATRLEGEGQQPRILGLVLREADGISSDDARAIAAAKNIAEGTGNAVDAAKILRSRPDIGVDLPPTSALVRDAQGLAKLSDDGFGMVINKKVPAGYAAIVGRLAPDPKTHAELLGVLAKEQPENAIEAESMVRDALDAPAVQATMEDMFGASEVTQILFKERATVLSAAATAIRKDRAAFSTLVREEARLTGAGNRLATETNIERATQDAEVLATLQATARRKGPVADALAAAAKRLKDGEPRQTVVRDFLDALRRSSKATGTDGGGAGAPGRPGEAIAASLGGYRDTDSPAFKRWWRDGKLVDAEDNPVMVYHGTTKAFDRVDPEKGAMGTFWFGSDKGAIERGESGAASAREVMPLYVRIEKPAGWAEYDKYSVGELEALGYDGVVLPEKDGSFTGFVWKPTQVKSAFNRGTWDPEDPRIAFSTRPQKDMDIGLFGDGQNQLDLVDLARIPKMVRIDADYLDFTPSAASRTATIGDASITYAAREGEVEILAVRIPGELRRQGRGRAAMLAFLERADERGLAVRTYATPLDRSIDREAITKFYESLGFAATGKKVRGDMEMLRSGPPPELQTLRQLVGDGFLIPLRDYTDPAMAHQVEVAFIGAQMERTTDELYSGGVLQRRQDELIAYAREVGKETGAILGNPGVKDRAKAEEKIGRKGYRSTRQLTDLVRAGFTVTSPDQAQRVINMLAQKFHVMDQGWAVTPQFYFDRKVLVRFSDGTIGEVQIWEPSLIDAKTNKGGHDLYEAARELPNGDPKKADLERKMTELYRPLVEALDPSWGATVGRDGNWPNVARNSSSPESIRPESPTSAESTGVQSSPGARMAKAEPGAQTAGRPSQLTNDQSMETSVSDQGKAFSARPQPLSNMPVNRSQAGAPAAPAMKAERLEDIAADLRAITGSPVRQGRLARAPKGKVAGQYDRDQSVIRLRDMADIETQSHETAHALETEWGRTLQNLKLQHRRELEPLAYAGADPRQQLSEGFAEWFRFYVSNPNYARRQAPTFTRDFEAMLTARAPQQLEAIKAISQRYMNWTLTPSGQAVAADIVSQRRSNAVSEAMSEMREEGPKAVIGQYMTKTYTALLDKLHPINKAVDELLKVYEQRTGQALDLKSAQDPYRLARLLQDSYGAGLNDAMHGVVPYHGLVSEGPSLSDAISLALGNQFRGWDDAAMADFAAYLTSRRALVEYDRFFAGEIPNPPGKFTRGDYEVTVRELEAANPNYAMAADMVHEWGRRMLRKKYESGFITQDLYDELIQRQDYVPMMRDLRDLDRDTTAPANMTLRNSIMKAFKGSKRSVINPLESMLADAFHFNALMKQNDVFRALDDLARMAGPGSGKIVERIPSTQLKGTKANVNEIIKIAAKDAGLSPQDVDQMTSLVDTMMGPDATGTFFRAGDINEKGEPIIYVWRDGKKHALRLADGEFGRDLYNSLTGMNKEAHNLAVSVMALPTTIVRYGVTTAPHFVLANYIRDQVSAWVLTGDGFIPFLSGARGLYDEVTQAEITRIYNTFGGIMGGGNVASLDKARVKRDINSINKKGYHIKRFASIRGFAEFTELTETGTRLAIFRNQFKRAKKEGLTDFEAAVEAAYQARDYIDFGRHGSQTHTARRLVTFLNASVQGLNKTVRVLTGEGSIRKAIAPYVMHRTGRPLSARDRRNIGQAAKAWAKVTAIGVFGLGLAALYKDDPEYQEISDYLRATHWMVKKGPGEWYAIPKPFELGFISNLFERSYESVYGRNPIAMQSFLSGLYEITAPPTGIPLFETMYELMHNKDGMGREIVGRDIAGFEPWRQYTAQTSEIAKALGRAVDVSPAMIDHAIQGFGASWGRIITDASTARNQGKGIVETASGAITNRFIRDVTRGATSTRQFWDLISEDTGAMAQTSATYKNLFENGSEVEAERLLSTKDENTKAYALLTTHFEAKIDRLHPMVRARDAISVISKLRREIAGNDVRMIDDEEGRITLVPTERQMAQDLLAKLSMIEARNALVTIGTPGWAQKQLMETESLMEDLRTTSPELAEEMTQRMEKKKVYDFEAVREVWPEVKNRILEDRQDAYFDDLVAGM